MKTAVDRVNKGKGRIVNARFAQALMKMDLVILDELGYLPFSQAGGALLFHLLSKLYEHTSVIITTILPPPVGTRKQKYGISKGNPAMAA
jgi:DNA replication protein DnaC